MRSYRLNAIRDSNKKNFFQFCTAFVLLLNEKNDRDVLANFENHLNNQLILRNAVYNSFGRNITNGLVTVYHIAGNSNTCKGGDSE